MQTLTTPCKHEHHQIGAYAKAGKVDPTHTTTLRNAFAREMKSRYLTLARAIKKAVDEQDCFGLKRGDILSMASVTLPGELAFAFPRSSQKVAAFMDWIQAQNKLFLESKGVWTEGIKLITAPQLGIGVEDVWTNKYIHSAYQKGIFRARQEMKKAGYNVPSIGESGGLGVALNQPMHIDRLGLVYSRTYEELKGINASMSSQISRVLSQGMAEGRNPRELAIILASTVMGPVGGLGITDTLGRFIPAARRAEIMARTEIIRAHHVATIQEYRNWGLEGVQVQGEWATAGDDRVCDECAELHGKVFPLDEIESMIPVHPQCRCIALPIEEKDTIMHKEEQTDTIMHKEEQTDIQKVEGVVPSISNQWKTLSDYTELEEAFSKQFRIYGINAEQYAMKDRMELLNSLGNHFTEIMEKHTEFRKIISNMEYNESIRFFNIIKAKQIRSGGIVGEYFGSKRSIDLAGGLSRKTIPIPTIGRKSWDVGKDFFTTFRHEYGHHIQTIMKQPFRKEWTTLFRERGETWFVANISRYGGANYEEGFAECFAAYTSPRYSEAKRKLPAEIEDFFRRLLG